MARRDNDRLEIAAEIRDRFADPAELSPIQARSFVRCLQYTWDVDQIRWSATDSSRLLADGWRLLHAASIYEELKGSDAIETRQLYQRAGELFEWLERSDDRIKNTAPLALLAGGAYQLASLPAMASSLLKSATLEHEGEKLFAAFIIGDFDRVLNLVSSFWERDETGLDGNLDLDRDDEADILSWRFTVETVRAIGLFSYTLRRGLWDRNELSIEKLEALAKHGQRVLPASLASLMQIIALAARRFLSKSIYHPLLTIAGDDESKQKRAKRYARRLYGENRGTLWTPQIRGLERLIESSSFALCTPTGSGKTLVANIALIKELLFNKADELTEPLALYIVPSRALASEVENKLSTELGDQVIITGLYGGNDWGMTDYWLDSDKPVIVVATVEKAEALFRNLGPLILGRLTLLILDEAHQVVLDSPDQALKRFARHTDRSLRLESFVTRLFVQKPGLSRIALTAVAGGTAGPVARWIESNIEAEPIGGNFRSTRQVIGTLEAGRDINPRLRLDLVNGIDIEVRGRRGESPYINLQFGPIPKLPNGMYDSLDRFNQLNILWAAMKLANSDQRVLISIAQQPENTMRWCCEALDHETWRDIDNYEGPESEKDQAAYAEALSSCADYCGEVSYEYRLLQSGIATSHGQMPQRLRRLMNRLIEDGICPITIATATLTEGVNLPFDVIFVPSLKRPYFDPVRKVRELQPMSASEFLNLSGRAGRPGASRHGEGMTFVAIPRTNAATAPGKQLVQSRQRRELLQQYNDLKAVLSDPPELGEDSTPLAKLLDAIYSKAKAYLNIDDTAAFFTWLEQVAPGDISGQAGEESEDNNAIVADTLDELDGILLAATEEAKGVGDELSPAQIEAALVQFWRSSFSALATEQEDWMETAFIKRGIALTTTIYPDSEERSRLYSYGLTPNIGQKFEAIGEVITERLKAELDYGSKPASDRLEVFQNIGNLLMDNRGFGFSVRETVTDQNILEEWENILSWWFNIDGADGPEPTELRSWQRFVSNNLEFRLGVAIGAAVSKAWNDGAEDRLQVPTLETWKETTGLPWVAFWARELIRWGTHDPFIAFAMAQGISQTREDAQIERKNFKEWLAAQDDIDAGDAESLIDPQHFMAWKKSERTTEKTKRERFRHAVEHGDALKKASYHVTPLHRDGSVEWIDPAGYRLAKSREASNTLPRANTLSDYLLKIKSDDGSEVIALYRKG